MSQLALFGLARQWSALLDATINDSVTSLVLSDDGADGAPDVPFLFHIGSEVILCTAITNDSPSSGKDTLTLDTDGNFTQGGDGRGMLGTGAAAHTAGDAVKQMIDIGEIQNLQDRMKVIETLVGQMLGGGEGVVSTDAQPELEVTAQGTPDMTVNVAVGGAYVDGTLAYLSAAFDSATLVAPVTNPRIDGIQIDSTGHIEVVAGVEAGSPSPPAASADALAIAGIYHRVGETSIKDADDSTNGYIIDGRVYL